MVGSMRHEINLRALAKQTEISLLPFSISDLISEVRTEFFPAVDTKIDCCFGDLRTLGFIEKVDGDNQSIIALHSVLNHKDTPREAIKFIVKHEFLHLVIRPRVIDGKLVSHPPDFWERENELSPERNLIWRWIRFNFDHILTLDRQRECLQVRRYGLKKIKSGERISFQQTKEIADFWDGIERDYSGLI